MKSPITYYGGKKSIIQHILPLLPNTQVYNVYTEPFFGGGTVFFAKDPAQNETINDRLDIVVNFYKQLKNNYKKLKTLIDATTYSRADFIQASKAIKDKSGAHSDIVRAWAFWFKINFSHSNKLDGGLKYSNSQTVAPAQILLNKKAAFTQQLQQRIENAIIENTDALKVINSRNVKNAFHYIDPPYPNADNGHYKGYSWEDYFNLLTTMENIKGRFIQSSYNSPMLEEFVIKNGWHKLEITHRLSAPRKSGPAKVEVLILNYHPNDTLKLF